MRVRTLIPIVAVVVTLVIAAVFLAHLVPASSASSAGASAAPTFTLTDIHGNTFALSHYRNTTVVAIEFTSLSCSACQIVEKSLASLYTTYDVRGPGELQIVSVFIEPGFGDTIPALQAYQVTNNVSWTMVQDTPSLAVSRSYGVSDIPDVFIVDKQGDVVYDGTGIQSTSTLQSSIDSAMAGTAKAISIATVSVFALAAIAGVSTFFSPCAFPMFPGYMSLFLGLTATGTESGAAPAASYKGAMRRAVLAGSVTAIGMILVFLVIGVALIFAANLVGAKVPYLQVLVGVVLVALGLLLLTNLQYWRIVTPLQRLWARVRGTSSEATPITAPSADGRGLYVKLFSYGMGYAAAAAGCVFPVILAAIVAGLALGLLGGILNILIYSLTAALLMILVTIVLGVAGKKYVNQLKAFTPVIKKVSAVALIVVGVYLVYFFYTAWVL